MRKIPLTFPLFDSVYGNSFPEEQYYVILFDALPSTYSTHDLYSQDVVKHFVDDLGFLERSRIMNQRNNFNKKSEQILLVNDKREIIISIRTKFNQGPGLVSFDVHYNIERGELESQLDYTQINEYLKETKKSNIQLVKSEMGHLDTEEYDLEIPECNLELNYGKDFLSLHDTIVKRLNTKNDKGIILFHGENGTGKTTYIKILTKLVTNKDILFIPPSMAEMLSEPSIIPFLMEHQNSILLIEDAEKVIADREGGTGSQAGVSNILNLTDGILGDCLNIQVIATFNTARERIDKALLRKGRLICEHKFDKLNVKETNELLKYLNKGVTSDKSLTLADIYNIDVDTARVTHEPTKVGFQFGEK